MAQSSLQRALLGWRAKVDLQPVLDCDADKVPQKIRQQAPNRFRWVPPRLGRLLRPQDLPAENVVQRIFAWMAADRTTSATHKRLLTPVHLLLGDHLIDARHLLRLGDHNGANDDDPAFEASFFACYQARPATEGNLSAVTVLDLLQKRTVHFCSRYNTVTGASAPPRPPSHPPLAPSSLIALLSPIEAGQTVYRTPRTYVVVRAWPRANAIPNRSLVHFDAPALSQL